MSPSAAVLPAPGASAASAEVYRAIIARSSEAIAVIDPTGVQLTIGSYPGAKVTDMRPAAVAKRKAAILRRAYASCRKHHHSKKYCRRGY